MPNLVAAFCNIHKIDIFLPYIEQDGRKEGVEVKSWSSCFLLKIGIIIQLSGVGTILCFDMELMLKLVLFFGYIYFVINGEEFCK